MHRVVGVIVLFLAATGASGAATQGGALPGPLPLFPASNWWNLDVSSAPLDPGSAAYIRFVGPTRGLHPDLGGEVCPGCVGTYGMPYIVVDASQPKRTVTFGYDSESDHVGYPIPDEAITEPHWIEGGEPGNQDPGDDRHMLIVDRDNKYLYELYRAFWDGSKWTAGSGAFFDMKTNNRRPEGWTSADAAGLAILPGLIRYDEVYGPDEIRHALRVTVRATNEYVWPASHRAGSTAGALPMGARLRLKAGKDISGFPADVQKIFRAMKTYGLIVADNGSDMYVTGTFDTRWNNGVLNPAFAALKAGDFEVVKLGYQPSSPPGITIEDRSVPSGGAANASFRVYLSAPYSQTVTVSYSTADGTAFAGVDYATTSGTLTFSPGRQYHSILVPILSTNETTATTFSVQLSNPVNATLTVGEATGTITPAPAPATVPMYRAYNFSADYHFFTTSLAEKTNAVAHGYRDESTPIPFKVPNTQVAGASAIFRMYNPNSGRHYYTAGAGERDSLKGVGWIYEKDEGFIYTALQTGTAEVFRLYNNNSGVHLYTASAGEKNAVLATFPGIWVQHQSLGWAVP